MRAAVAYRKSKLHTDPLRRILAGNYAGYANKLHEALVEVEGEEDWGELDGEIGGDWVMVEEQV